MTTQSSNAATIGRQLPADQWQVPGFIDSDDTRLMWAYRDKRTWSRFVTPEPTLLETFVGLATGTAQEIKLFAQRFGVLYICEHGMPSTHDQTVAPSSDTGFAARCPLKRIRGNSRPTSIPTTSTLYWEPLEAWRTYARQARTILSLSVSLRHGRGGSTDEWSALYPPEDAPATVPEELAAHAAAPDAVTARVLFSAFLDGWMQMGGVQPHLAWTPHGAEITFGSRSLFGAVVTQLLLAVSGTTAYAFCSSCGKVYRPTRVPRLDQRHYCPSCGDKAKWKDAQRDRRRRKLADQADAQD